MSFAEYLEKKNRVISALEDVNKNISDERLKNIIESKVKTLRDDKFTISIFGHYSAGKSSFLNALMGFGDEVLKEDELPTTATITRLKYPESQNFKNKVEIIYKSGEKVTSDLKDIESYTTTTTNIDVENEISEVIFYVESELLKNKVEIVDTPGFNSTNELHTEIAKRHIANSDASIYLFDYKQAGTDKDFKFLADINDKMDRIFLVLNKVDLHDDTEGEMSETIESLRYKIERYGATVKNKKIYPISAMKKKMILNGSEDNKFFDDLFNCFSDELAKYLTGEENIKDRLIAPLKNILSEVLKVREDKNTQISVLNLEGDEIDKKIEDLRLEIEELTIEFNDRRKDIRRLVKKSINKFILSINEKKDEIDEEIPVRVTELKSAFSLNEDAFKDMVDEVEGKIKRKVTQEKGEFISSILEIVDNNIDSNAGYDDLIKKIEESLRVQINRKEWDFSLAKKEEEYMESLKKDLDKKEEELRELENNRNYLRKETYKLEQTDNKIKRLRTDIRALESQKSNMIMSIGEGISKTFEGSKIVERERSGFFGRIANKLWGNKRETINERMVDDSDIEYKNQRKNDIRSEYDSKINDSTKKLKDLEKESTDIGVKKFELADNEKKLERERERFYKQEKLIEDREFEYESEIFEKNKRKIKNEILDYVDELVEDIKNGVVKNEGIIKVMVEESLVDLKNSINIKQESIDEIRQTQISGNKDVIKSNLMVEVTKLNDVFNKVNTIKEEIA